jgi:hypothetical protein
MLLKVNFIFDDGERGPIWANWATFSQELVQVVRHAKETNFEHLLTGDESWFHYECSHDAVWDQSMSTLLTRKAQKIQTEKGLIFIIWSTSGIHSLLGCRLGSDTVQIFLCICFV